MPPPPSPRQLRKRTHRDSRVANDLPKLHPNMPDPPPDDPGPPLYWPPSSSGNREANTTPTGRVTGGSCLTVRETSLPGGETLVLSHHVAGDRALTTAGLPGYRCYREEARSDLDGPMTPMDGSSYLGAGSCGSDLVV